MSDGEWDGVELDLSDVSTRSRRGGPSRCLSGHFDGVLDPPATERAHNGPGHFPWGSERGRQGAGNPWGSPSDPKYSPPGRFALLI